MPTKVLTQDDLERIDTAIEQGEELRQELDRARLAGIDIGDRAQKLEANLAKLRSIRSAFFEE